VGAVVYYSTTPTILLAVCLRETILPYLEQFALVVVDEAFMDFLPPDQEQSLISVVQNIQI